MKKGIVAVLVLLSVSFNASAAVKCVPDGRGGTCCWDVNKDGPFRPLGC
jgi:hypothetical protein